MKSKILLSCAILLSILLIASACSDVSQEEYDKLAVDLAQTQEELDAAKDVISQLQVSLAETGEELQGVKTELDYYKANPPVIEVDFVDIGEIAKLTKLRVSGGATANNTYIIECELELTGDLPGRVNVVDVELYVNIRFTDSERWIDISSTGFITTKPVIYLDTGLQHLDQSIQIRVIPSFKVFGAH
ncbi:hypothetical protein ACFLXV_02285 [Chloroflexota bacterium]